MHHFSERSVRELLNKLSEAMYRPAAPVPVAGEEVTALVGQALVVIPAGGFGTRMRGAGMPEGGIQQKALLPLPGGETLIGRLVRQYREAGFRRFLALVNHEGQAVAEHLGDGAAWGVEIRCSFDPIPAGAGRSGALRHAMAMGLITPEDRLIVHNADCQLMGYPGCLSIDLARAHLATRRQMAAVATLVAVDGTPYPFTGMRIQCGRVTEVAMYPFIPLPTHTGITLLDCEAQQDLQEEPDAGGRGNFEATLFPRWAGEGRLGALVISHAHWVAVDDQKSYQRLCGYLTGRQSTGS
ncbi:MAG: NTP transferase domain-containing protein [Armatimonadetes bacterium]|nr:NTP transferase domain-containing protein [Armatimonadota bacterium]